MTLRNFEIFRGDTLPFTAVIKSNDLPVDITGAQFRMTGKYRVQDADSAAVFTLFSPDNITIVTPLEGTIQVTIPPSATLSLGPRNYHLFYDLQMRASGGDVYTICAGRINVFPDVSITSP